jgi:hypothetical protein
MTAHIVKVHHLGRLQPFTESVELLGQTKLLADLEWKPVVRSLQPAENALINHE